LTKGHTMTTTISDKISPKDGQLSNDACEAIAQRVTKDRADAERLEWMLRRVSGSWLRAHLGAVGDTGDMAELRRLIDSQRQPARKSTPQMPMLPDWLLNAIGEYGMARTDRVSDVEIQHRWQELIRYIKRYAADCVSATTLPQPNEAKK